MSKTKLTLYIESREKFAKSPMNLVVPYDTTVSQLKKQVHDELKFPLDVQLWVAKRKALKDGITVRECDLIREYQDNDIWLYLLSAEEKEQKKRGTLSIHITTPLGNKLPVDLGMPTAQVIAQVMGWTCCACTFLNEPTRPGCEVCSTDRPDGYHVPGNYKLTEKEKQRLAMDRREQDETKKNQQEEAKRLEKDRQQSYLLHLKLEEGLFVSNSEQFECVICNKNIEAGQGVGLRECGHMFCKNCLADHIKGIEDPEIPCPEKQCEGKLQEREIRGVAEEEVYQNYITLCHRAAESQGTNSFHCMTVDCPYWVICENKVKFFNCEACGQYNCLVCGAIHQDMTCEQYQNKMKAPNDPYVEAGLKPLDINPHVKIEIQFQVVNIKATRHVNLNDPFENYYRLAEGHFLRMLVFRGTPQRAKIESIDIVINKDLEAKFEAKRLEFQAAGIPEKVVLAYHGTAVANVQSILKENLQVSKARAQAYGRGNYFSEFPDISIGYGPGLLLCKLLPGNEWADNTATNVPAGYHSKLVRPNAALENSSEMVIIENSDQILPSFVIHLCK